MARRIILTDYQKEFISANYLKMARKEMGQKIGLFEGIVSKYMHENGLVVTKEISRGFASAKMYKPFTESEDNFIHDNIQNRSIKWIAKELKRTSAYVARRVRELGYSDLIQQKALDSRIQKGAVPSNKGKKQKDYMSEEAIARTVATRFKKGGLPPTSYNEVGKITERTDHGARNGRTYLYKCVKLGKWVPLHKLIWEEAHGKIPKTHCLWFKDGNTLNCTLDNLELITRAENLKRNNWSDHGIAAKIARISGAKKRGQVDRELKDFIVEHAPGLVELKRQQLLLNSELKKLRNDKNANRK